MAGKVMVAAGLALVVVDFEGDERLDWWWLSLLLIVLGAVIWAFGPWVATPEQDAVFSAVDEDIDAHMTPGRGGVVSGDAATLGGFDAPAGSASEGAGR